MTQLHFQLAFMLIALAIAEPASQHRYEYGDDRYDNDDHHHYLSSRHRSHDDEEPIYHKEKHTSEKLIVHKYDDDDHKGDYKQSHRRHYDDERDYKDDSHYVHHVHHYEEPKYAVHHYEEPKVAVHHYEEPKVAVHHVREEHHDYVHHEHEHKHKHKHDHQHEHHHHHHHKTHALVTKLKDNNELFVPAIDPQQPQAATDPIVYASAPNSVFHTQINVQSQDAAFNAQSGNAADPSANGRPTQRPGGAQLPASQFPNNQRPTQTPGGQLPGFQPIPGGQLPGQAFPNNPNNNNNNNGPANGNPVDPGLPNGAGNLPIIIGQYPANGGSHHHGNHNHHHGHHGKPGGYYRLDELDPNNALIAANYLALRAAQDPQQQQQQPAGGQAPQAAQAPAAAQAPQSAQAPRSNLPAAAAAPANRALPSTIPTVPPRSNLQAVNVINGNLLRPAQQSAFAGLPRNFNGNAQGANVINGNVLSVADYNLEAELGRRHHKSGTRKSHKHQPEVSIVTYSDGELDNGFDDAELDIDDAETEAGAGSLTPSATVVHNTIVPLYGNDLGKKQNDGYHYGRPNVKFVL